MTPRRLWTAVAVGLAIVLTLVFGPIGAVRADESIRPVLSCADVKQLTIPDTTITSASVRRQGVPAPFCAVRGTIAPAVTFVLRLPTDGWTGRYLQTGCGGLCGRAAVTYTQASECTPVADGTIAGASSDLGHPSRGDGSWAAGNPRAILDFAYRANHVTAVTAKAIIARYYGRAPDHSYFSGCSDGGREALMEAQRYPDDFDGIVAGAPAANLVVQDTFHHAWGVLTNRDAAGRPILLAGRLPLVHRAVLAACDTLDGLADGLLDDPRRCGFDPYTQVCRPGQNPGTCLTTAEAGVVQRLHDGATDVSGRRLEPAISREWGSELDWTLFVPARPGDTTWSESYALAFLRYLAYADQPGPAFRLTDLAFTEASFHETVRTSATLSATDPDLSAFRRHGGKLLLWHGWSDEHVSPQSTIAYWDAMRHTMGPLDGFARLYLFPGLGHCTGGPGPNSFDILTPMLNWVEHGQAPYSIVAHRGDRGRPVYPYPLVARWDGSGSPDSAGNFRAVRPIAEPAVDPHWAGEYLYAHGYQTPTL